MVDSSSDNYSDKDLRDIDIPDSMNPFIKRLQLVTDSMNKRIEELESSLKTDT